MTLLLRKISETTSDIVLGWDPPEGVEWYLFYAGGKRVSNAAPIDKNGTVKNRVRFSKTLTPQEVVAITRRNGVMGIEVGVYTGEVEPPPPTSKSPMGFYKLGSGALKSNPDRYGILMVSAGGAKGAGARSPKSLVYMSALSCRGSGDNYGLSASEARAINAVLRDGEGELLNASYPASVLGDPGSSAYQKAWCEGVERMVRSYGVDGFWGDDLVQRSPTALSGGRMPNQYPTLPQWQAAIQSFVEYVGNYMRSKGILCGWNAQPGYSGNWDTNGSITKTWWEKIAPFSDYLMCEYHLKHDAISTNGGLKVAGSGWGKEWDGWRALHPACNAWGVNMVSVNYGAMNSPEQRYCLATFMLDWDGKGSSCWGETGSSGGSDSWDPWGSIYESAAALGSPTGPAVKQGNEWVRTFANGTVRVNPTAVTSSIG